VEPRGGVISDGKGGLWVAGAYYQSPQWYAMHRTRAGVWSRVAIVGFASDLAHIPGTTSEVGVGSTFSKTVDKATIWATGAL
jgi:hypothetical protein